MSSYIDSKVSLHLGCAMLTHSL